MLYRIAGKAETENMDAVVRRTVYCWCQAMTAVPSCVCVCVCVRARMEMKSYLVPLVLLHVGVDGQIKFGQQLCTRGVQVQRDLQRPLRERV